MINIPKGVKRHAGFVLVWVMHDPYQDENTKNGEKPHFYRFQSFLDSETTLALQANLKLYSPVGCQSRAWPYALRHTRTGGSDHRPQVGYRQNGHSGLRVCAYALCVLLLKYRSNRPIWGWSQTPFFHVFQECTIRQEGQSTTLERPGNLSKMVKKGQKCKKCQNPDFIDFIFNQFRNDSDQTSLHHYSFSKITIFGQNVKKVRNWAEDQIQGYHTL